MKLPMPLKVLGTLDMIWGLMVFAFGVYAALNLTRSPSINDAITVGTLVGLGALFFSGGLLTARGSIWGRNILLIAAIVRAFGFPVGTIWAGFIFYYLVFDKNVSEYFSSKTIPLEVARTKGLLKAAAYLRNPVLAEDYAAAKNISSARVTELVASNELAAFVWRKHLYVDNN